MGPRSARGAPQLARLGARRRSHGIERRGATDRVAGRHGRRSLGRRCSQVLRGRCDRALPRCRQRRSGTSCVRVARSEEQLGEPAHTHRRNGRKLCPHLDEQGGCHHDALASLASVLRRLSPRGSADLRTPAVEHRPRRDLARARVGSAGVHRSRANAGRVSGRRTRGSAGGTRLAASRGGAQRQGDPRRTPALVHDGGHVRD
eukprot:Amastigsp_a843976_41.p4 type:complete len:203 gc:universal Amastigsp_a843976_41:916-308(-)